MFAMSGLQAAEEARLSEARAAMADREARASAREAAAAEAAAAVDRRAEVAEAATRAVAEREAELRRLQGEVWTKVQRSVQLTDLLHLNRMPYNQPFAF
jgi:hypothetical protein